MNEKICYIIGAGDYFQHTIQPAPGDLVIAADGGYGYLQQAHLEADIVLGDFDSLPAAPNHPHVIVLNKEKDDTDMLAAIHEGLGQGYLIFRIYGGTGGRFEHTLANLQCLAYLAQNGARGELFGRDTVVTAIAGGELAFEAGCAGLLSVFSHTDKALGVTLRGLKYPLDNYTMTNTFPIGVSNEFIGERATVSVRAGTLFVVYPQSAKLL